MLKKTLGALLLASGILASSAIAVPINGEVHFTGFANLEDGGGLDASPASATFIDFANPINVVEQISFGSYAGLDAATTATFTDFSFGALGSTGAVAVSPLWSFTDAGTGRTYDFSLSSITLNQMAGTQRVLEGNGIATISGVGPTYDSTPMFWSLSTSGTQSTISFSSFNASVPDSGSTIALLGLSLLAMAAFVRRSKSA